MSSTVTISPSNPDAPFASREELEVRLASEYGPHLAILDQRLDDALRASGFEIHYAGLTRSDDASNGLSTQLLLVGTGRMEVGER